VKGFVIDRLGCHGVAPSAKGITKGMPNLHQGITERRGFVVYGLEGFVVEAKTGLKRN
jgi:hypothetical protein